MIYVTIEHAGLRLTRGDESFFISDSETPIFLANLITRLTGRADYADGYKEGLSDGYKRAEAEYTGRTPRPPRTRRTVPTALISNALTTDS